MRLSHPTNNPHRLNPCNISAIDKVSWKWRQ